MASDRQRAIEQAIRDFPGDTKQVGKTYGLDDLDFEEFVPALAAYIEDSL